MFGVLRDKLWGLRKTLEYLSLQAEATFYRLLESAEIKVWLNPCENELEILWGENVILVSIITDVIIWLQPEEVLTGVQDRLYFCLFFPPDLSSFSESILGFENARNKTIDNLKIS